MRLMRRTACLALLCVALIGCNGDKSTGKNPALEPKLKEIVKTDTKVGDGFEAAPGDQVWVMYSGKMADGTEFDTNMGTGGMPFAVQLSTKGKNANVIKGWDEGLIGIKQGGERKIDVPYKFAYGEEGDSRKIPPRTDLFFTVKALYVLKTGQETEFDKTDIKVGTGPEAKEGDTVTFHYKGEYLNGQEFDNSEKRPSGSKPVTAKLGETSGTKDKLIVGMDYGIRGMKEGGERKVTLPPNLVFGQVGNQSITGNQPVVFTIKLIKVGG